MQRLVFLTVLLSAFTFAQAVDTYTTAQMQNGRLWQEMTEAQKTAYMSGLHDALLGAVFAGTKEPSNENLPWADRFSVADYIKVLDDVYSHQENVRIPIALAVIVYSTPKLRGNETTTSLENRLRTLRQAIAGVN